VLFRSIATKTKELSALQVRNHLERVRKNKLQGNYIDDDLDSGETQSLFSNNFNDDDDLLFDDSLVNPEIIRPTLSWWDKNDLIRALKRQEDKYNKANTNDMYNQDNIPKHISYDLYSLFNNPMSNIQFSKPTDENQWQFDLMQRFNDYLLRGITENNSVNSFVTVNEFIKMLSKLVEQEKKKPENQGKSNEELLQQVVKNGSNGSVADQKKFQRALDQAKKNIEEKQQQVEQASGLQAGKSDTPFDFKEIDQLLDFANLVKHMPLNHKFVANFVNQSLKFSSGYFSNSYKQYEESILDSDVVDNIENFEELLPVYKNLNIEDLMTNYRKYNLSFDIFIDNSGSMDSSYRFDGKSVSGFDLCKIMALKLNNMKLVKDVYLFNDSYKKVNNLNEIFKLRTSGGTQIDKVVQYVNSTGRPAVVLTDMQDTVYNHSKNIFFIGILDARFNFRESAIKFGTNKQCVRFNENGTFTKVYQK